MNSRPHIIIGDLNLHTKAEDQTTENLHYIDTWKKLYGNHTSLFHSLISDSKQGNTYGAYRLDRLLYKDLSLKPKSMKILDNKLPEFEKQQKNEFLISDHKGIIATFVQ